MILNVWQVGPDTDCRESRHRPRRGKDDVEYVCLKSQLLRRRKIYCCNSIIRKGSLRHQSAELDYLLILVFCIL